MKETYALTVIIPTYNNEKYIKRCLDSILNQCIKNIKVVIIDDHSTDNTFDIVEKYQSVYENIEYYISSGRGPGAARNKGIEKCNTKYIAFIDSDDWIDLNSYKKCIEQLDAHPQCNIAVIGIMTEFDSYILAKHRYTYEEENIITSNMALALLTNANNYSELISPLVGNKVYRSDLILNNNILFPKTYFEDNVFMFKVFYYSKYVLLIPNCYLHYYQRANSIMHSFSKEYIDDFFENFSQIRIFLKSKNQFKDLENIYYAYFQRGCKTLINILFSVEQDVQIQKKYLLEFMKSIEKNFDIDELIKNMDINLLKNVWGI